jgi:hypothetical protein
MKISEGELVKVIEDVLIDNFTYKTSPSGGIVLTEEELYRLLFFIISGGEPFNVI